MSSKKALTLTIVIPAYNEENHLKACLDSIAAQSIKPDEVIVVDNNSIDQTAKIAKSYAFARVVNEKQQGIVYARTKGFNEAKSGIIGRIDADIVLPPDWVKEVKNFYADPAHLDHGFTGGGRPNNLRFPKISGWLLGQIAFRINRLLLGHYILFGSNMAIPKTMWLNVRKQICKRTDIHEDLDLAIHAHEAGYKITYHENVRVTGRGHRIMTERDQLLDNLLMWPKTLRVHHKWTWIFGWLGAIILYALSPTHVIIDKIARLFGKQPLQS